MIFDRLRVFISSRMAELAPERAALKEALDELNIDAWVFEVDAGARPQTIEQTYKEELEKSDLFIGVFWKGYGDYTIDEFEHAQLKNKPSFVYLKHGDRLPDRDPQLQAFLDRIGKVESGKTIQFFDTADELREMVKRDAARWQMDEVRRYRGTGAQHSSAGLPADSNLVILRNKVQQFWINGVLGRSIDAGFVDLSKEHSPEATDQPWEAVLELPFEGSRVVEPNATLLDIFDELDGSLLVLGQPGSGKTTTVLQLARDLIKRSVRDESRPVPVMLSLSTWTPEFPSLLTWIAKEISSKYQIPGRITRPWIEQERLILILDGLDEVAAEFREACVAAINRLSQEYRLAGLVVTSRLEEYNQLSVRLHTNGAICLQPLGPQQIDAWLDEAGGKLDGLRALIRTDDTLREMARSPLMLSVMSMAYRDRSAAELRAESGSSEERRAHLFDTYVNRAFEEQPQGRWYSRAATTAWLAWIARRMSQRNQAEFMIEELQPGWLARRWQLGAYLVGFAVLFGLVFGALFIVFRVYPSHLNIPDDIHTYEPDLRGWSEALAWIAGTTLWFLGIAVTDGLSSRAVNPEAEIPVVIRRLLTNVVLFALLWVPIMTVFFACVDILPKHKILVGCMPIAPTMAVAALCARRSLSRSIHTTESLGLTWVRAARGALIATPLGLALGAIAFIISTTDNSSATDSVQTSELLLVVAWFLIPVTFGAIFGGFEPRVVKGKTVPNQGMMLTIRTSMRAARLAILFSAAVLLACLCADDEYRTPKLMAIWATATFVVVFVSLAMWFGGFDIGKHVLLRGLIGFTRQGPWNFARLLNESTRLNLTQRVGGGYIFVHRLLRDHFAAMELPPPAREEVQFADAETSRFASPLALMTLLAVAGAIVLTMGLTTQRPWAIVLGAIGLGIGAQWIVIRTATTSALRAARREAEED